MYKKIGLSFIVSTSILLTNVSATDTKTFFDSFENGKVSGELRAFYINRNFDGIIENSRDGFAVGGNLGFETNGFKGFKMGAKFYTTNGLGLNKKNSADTDPSLFGDNFKSYSVLGEAYIAYQNQKTSIKIGRQKLNTPLAGADDARMLPNLFEAVVVANSDLPNTTLIGAYVTKMGVGSFANVYGKPSQLSLQGGYGLGYKLATTGDFKDMGDVALGENTDTKGVAVGAMIYKNGGFKAQLWDYYAYDILNAVYADATFTAKLDKAKLSISGQYINEKEVGDKKVGDIDVNYIGAKVGFAYNIFGGYVAYSTTDSDKNTVTHGGVISPWGGVPAYTQGMVTRHMFFANTDSMKIALSAKPLNNLKVAVYYANYDIGKENTYANGVAWIAKETGFDIIHQTTKNLKLRFRGNFPRDFKKGLDWNEYRMIGYYNF